MNRKMKGITLIALVITIIILLILSGITLIILTGDEGIINRAQIAKQKTEQAQQKDQDYLEDVSNIIDNISSSTNDEKKTKNNFVAYFNSVFNNGTTTLRDIDILDFNSECASVSGSQLTIKQKGEYTAYIVVGHSPINNSFTSHTFLFANGENIGQVSQDYAYADGLIPFTFEVEENKNKVIELKVQTGKAFASGITVFGSGIILKNK